MTKDLLNKWLPLFITALLLGGLLWSRALLSITEGIALAYGLFHFYKHKNNPFKTATLWSIVPAALFCLGIYQPNNFNQTSFDYLLTLLAYPSATFFVLALDKEQLRQLFYVWIAAVFISLLYPLGWYALHVGEAHERYRTGQSLPTFMYSDHVRYSLFLCSGFLILLYQNLFTKKKQTVLTVILALVILVLSVRTAWAGMLLIALVYCIGKVKWYALIAGIILSAGLAYAAYEMLPTVKQKINYTIYDWRMYPGDKYVPDFSDGARRTINNTAWETVTVKKRANTGWGNVPIVLKEEFKLKYPASDIKYGWPFNQFLYWWIGAGLTAMLLFAAWLFYPAFIFLKTKNKALLSWTIVIASTCMVESTLNMQYGVFLHAWVMALFFMQVKKIE